MPFIKSFQRWHCMSCCVMDHYTSAWMRYAVCPNLHGCVCHMSAHVHVRCLMESCQSFLLTTHLLLYDNLCYIYLSTCSTWKLFQRCLMSVLNIDLWKCYITYVRQTKASLNTYRCVWLQGGRMFPWWCTCVTFDPLCTQRENASDVWVCFRPCGHWLSLGLDMVGVHYIS